MIILRFRDVVTLVVWIFLIAFLVVLAL